MISYTRRYTLKALGKIAAFAATAPVVPGIIGCSRGERSIMFNVIFHGLFVFNFTDLCIEVLTPKVEEHLYQYGNWDIRSVAQLIATREYSFVGLRHEMVLPTLDESRSRLFSQSKDNFTVDSTQSYCRLFLPFPLSFRLLRCATVDDIWKRSGKDSDTTSAKDIDITKVSLCQVLTYYVPDYWHLQLTGTNWTPDVDRQTQTANLHFWAEPRYRLTPLHADHAYAKLNDLLPPLKLQLRVYFTPPLDRDTGVCGFPPQQEQGWADWASGGGEGTHPTNCCAVLAKK
jgi:hypothetical protein